MLVLGVLVGLLAVGLAFRDANLMSLLSKLSDVKPVWVAAGLLCYFVHFALKAWRWRSLLEPMHKLDLHQCWPPMMVGYLANNLLPAHLGELARMFVGARSFKLSASSVLATLILERILDMLSVLGMLGIVLVAGGRVSLEFRQAGMFVLVSVALLAGLMVLLASQPDPVRRLLSRLLFLLPHGFLAHLLTQIEEGAKGLAAILDIRSLAWVALLSLAQWLLFAAMIGTAFLAIDIPVDPLIAVSVLVATVFAVTLPSTPGYFGSVQLAFVLAAMPYGIGRDAALAASVVFHLSSWTAVTIAGLVAMQRLGLRMAELRAAGQVN